MNNNEISRITSEISKIENLIIPLKEYLTDNPNDLAVHLELKSFQKRINELNIDLIRAKNEGQIRNITIIRREIEEIDKLINENTYFMENNPNFSLNNDLMILKDVKKELLIELGSALNNKGLSSFDLHISPNDNKKVELNQLGHTCLSVQDVLISCAMYDGQNPVKKGAIYNSQIIENTTMQVEATAIGSLILLVSPKNPQIALDKESDIKRSLEQLSKIIDCGADKGKINSLMEEIGSQPIFKYKKLLSNLKDNNLNLDICYSVKPKGINTKSLTVDDAKKIYDLINDVEKEETDTINIIGKLYSVDVKNKKCGIEVKSGDLDMNKTIRVSFRDSFKKQLKEKLDTEINVSLERTIKINAVEDDSKPVFNLIELN